MKFVSRMAGLVLAAASMATSVSAADWPTRQVTIVVPTGAGGNTDLMARLAADYLSAKLGKPFIVENRPSAGGVLASSQVANAAPDGYTIMFTPSSAIVLTPLVQKMPFDPDKLLKPVTNVGTGAQVVAVKRSLGVNTLAEFFAYAKANPGKLSFAVAGTNNISHLGPILLFKLAGIDLVMIPARAEPAAISDLMAGTVDFYFGNVSILMQYKDNPAIRLLAVGADKRVAIAPDLPTISETLPDFVLSSWNGFMVPAGTDESIVETLRTEITAMVKQPETAARLSNLGIIPGGQSKAEVEAVFANDRKRFGDAVKAAGITAPQ